MLEEAMEVVRGGLGGQLVQELLRGGGRLECGDTEIKRDKNMWNCNNRIQYTVLYSSSHQYTRKCAT